jgi:hypothetical protein
MMMIRTPRIPRSSKGASASMAPISYALLLFYSGVDSPINFYGFLSCWWYYGTCPITVKYICPLKYYLSWANGSNDDANVLFMVNCCVEASFLITLISYGTGFDRSTGCYLGPSTSSESALFSFLWVAPLELRWPNQLFPHG